jgi:hypothetical protein
MIPSDFAGRERGSGNIEGGVIHFAPLFARKHHDRDVFVRLIFCPKWVADQDEWAMLYKVRL